MGDNMAYEMLALAAACAGACMDFKTGKIPNKLVMPCMLAGIVWHLFAGGLPGLVWSLTGIGVGFAMIVLWLLGALKAGDVKLYMAIGALGGWRFGLNTIVCSILTGGIVGLLLMLVRKSGRKSLRGLWNYGVTMLLTRSVQMYQAEDKSSYFCFGGCIAAGAAISIVWKIF